MDGKYCYVPPWSLETNPFAAVFDNESLVQISFQRGK